MKGSAKVAAGLAVLFLGGVVWFAWPDLALIASEDAKSIQRGASQRTYEEKLSAKAKADDEAFALKARSVGYEGVIVSLLKKKRLTDLEHSELGNAAGKYALELVGADPGKQLADIHYDDYGNVRTVKGHDQFFKSVYKKITEPYGPDASKDSSSSAASPLTSTVSWHVLQHFTGKGIKDTPTFAVNSPEWRIRWNIRKRSPYDSFSLYLYGPDGIPKVAASAQDAGSDASYMHGAGSYYLSINSGMSYDIWVEVH